jgi:hypothetical protein
MSKRKDHKHDFALDDLSSWDPLTQAKFIYAINDQIGTPITLSEAYRTAVMAIADKSETDQPSCEETRD